MDGKFIFRETTTGVGANFKTTSSGSKTNYKTAEIEESEFQQYLDADQ